MIKITVTGLHINQHLCFLYRGSTQIRGILFLALIDKILTFYSSLVLSLTSIVRQFGCLRWESCCCKSFGTTLFAQSSYYSVLQSLFDSRLETRVCEANRGRGGGIVGFNCSVNFRVPQLDVYTLQTQSMYTGEIISYVCFNSGVVMIHMIRIRNNDRTSRALDLLDVAIRSLGTYYFYGLRRLRLGIISDCSAACSVITL